MKFYLQVRPEPPWRHCVGPGVVDRLDLKGPKTFLLQGGLLPLEALRGGSTWDDFVRELPRLVETCSARNE